MITSSRCPISYGSGVIYLDLVNSMLSTDFASASVLISFGAVIGTTTPLQAQILHSPFHPVVRWVLFTR